MHPIILLLIAINCMSFEFHEFKVPETASITLAQEPDYIGKSIDSIFQISDVVILPQSNISDKPATKAYIVNVLNNGRFSGRTDIFNMPDSYEKNKDRYIALQLFSGKHLVLNCYIYSNNDILVSPPLPGKAAFLHYSLSD